MDVHAVSRCSSITRSATRASTGMATRFRFDRDNEYLIAYHRMLEKAVPRDTPVKFIMRADVSWDMERQFNELKNVVKFWVAGQGMLSWYPEAVRDTPRARRHRVELRRDSAKCSR